MDTSTLAEHTGFDALGLSDDVLAAVRDLGYTDPTPVQAAAIPEVLAGRDLLAAAQTGTGKTAAFLLPTMSRLGHVVPRGKQRRRGRGRGPLMLIVTPTRELAQQIEEVCMSVAERTGHIAVTVVGGVGYNPQRSALKNGCDILVATPGRLVDLLGEGACSLSEVQVLVLDEADRMLDMGFLPDVRKIVAATPDDRQTLLFSATLDEKAVGAVTDLVRDPARVEIAPPQSTADTVEQYVLPVSSEAKNGLLAQVLKREGPERVIVFMRTKHRADGCCRRLARAGIKAAAIHGNRTQAQRERALKAFRAGEVDVLVATDVLARGIDISDVRYVVNFDVPSEPTDYIHRIGRTGRAGEVGWALTFVTELDVEEFFDIEALMGKIADLYDADGLDVGVHPPVVDPDRVPASRAKKKTRRGKSTSKKKRGGRSASDRGAGDRAAGGRGADGRAGAARDAQDGMSRDGHAVDWGRRTGAGHATTEGRAEAATSAGQGAATGERPARKATRPARPKRAGSARVHASEETQASDASASRHGERGHQRDAGQGKGAGRAARSERGGRHDHGDQGGRGYNGQGNRDRNGQAGRDEHQGHGERRRETGREADALQRRTRGAQGRGKQDRRGRSGASPDALAHDWRNSDFVDDRRGRGGRGSRSAGNVGAREGRSNRAKTRTRRPGDFGGRR